MAHEPLCLNERPGFCLECAQLENIREAERYMVVAQIKALPADSSRDEIIEAVAPVTGDVLRRNGPYADFDN